MNDKVPPRNPFGIPGDRTIIRPNPGGRRPVAPPPSPGPPPAPYNPAQRGYGPPQPVAPAATPYVPPAAPSNSDPEEWIRAQAQAPPQPVAPMGIPEVRIDELVAPNENPILRSAGPLLLLLGRLRVALARASPASLMEQAFEAINFFERDIRSAGISGTQANSAKYLICCTADDIVQNIPTEDRHVWAQYSMESRLFGSRTGGVGFFDELARLKQDPAVNYDLLELAHTCLALGFHGIHRTSAGGVAALQQIQRDLYETLRRLRPKTYRELSPHWQGQQLASQRLRVRVPWWGVLGVVGLMLFGLYFVLLYWLTGNVDAAAAQLANLHDMSRLSIVRVPQPPPPPPPPEPDRVTQFDRICSALGSDVASGNATAQQTANQITLQVGDVILFASGSAAVLDQFKPLAGRIAQMLNKEEGFIKIVGHTDNAPISRSNVRFPDNYHLSVERAKSVAALFRPLLTQPERLQTDGKGEAAPIADNKTPEGRARNRRVEILIPRTDTGPVTKKACAR